MDIQTYKYTMIKNGRRKKIRDDNSRRGELVSNIPQKAELRISTSKKGSLKGIMNVLTQVHQSE